MVRTVLAWRTLASALGAAAPVHAEWFERDAAIMGTAITVELWHRDEARARAALEAVLAEMHRIDALMSTYKEDSQLSAVNAMAAREPVRVSPELAALIRRSLEMSEITGGAFDITYASVGYLYDYRNRVRPDREQVEAALPAVDYRHVVVDEKAGTVRFVRDGVRIDLGGIAKGHAVERGVEILRSHGVHHGLVTAGGDTRVLGDRRGKPWIVGIRDPRRRGELVARLPLEDEAISTSGDYERYFEEDGVRYHHIIKPGTGESAREVRSVTVVGPDATTTDGLSTSVFVLGVDRGMQLIDGLEQYEAVIVTGESRMFYSRGFERPE